MSDNDITRCPGRFESVGVSWRQDASEVRPSCRGLWALSNSRLSNPGKTRKKCCYVRRRTWGQYKQSVSVSNSSLTHKNKVREIIFLWRRVFVRSLKLVYYVWLCFCLYLCNTIYAALLNTQYYKVKDQGESGTIKGMERHPSLYLGVVDIERGAFGLPSTKVIKFTYSWAVSV